MSSQAFRGHVRENLGLLAAAEKRCLVWLAKRLPRRVTSDHLTALGLAGMVGAGLALWATRVAPWALWLAVAGLVVNWFGDSLDGTLARVRDRQRPRYGFYVDHVVNVFGTLFLMVGLGLSSVMSFPLAIAVLLAFLMLQAEAYLATHTLGTFRMAHFKLGPTELRVLLALGLARAFFAPWVTVADQRWLLFDVGGVCAVAGMLVTLVVAVVRNTRELFSLEPLS